ncbi:MAG: N-acetylneuraminate lyase [Clostridia bacterium]
MKSFKGIFVALLTPFNKDNKINEDSVKKLIEFNIAEGVDGFYVGGSTGESMVMTAEERKQLFRCVAEAVNGRVTLIAHVGTVSTDAAIDMAKCAESLNYDAISAVAPFYYSFSAQAIKQYYEDIVASVDHTPMIIYNFPNSGGFTFTAQMANEIFKNEKFIGIKHTSNDMFMLQQFKHLDREIVVYNGFDEVMLAGLAMGADGAIGSTYNFMAHKFIEILKLFKAGKIAEAQAVQNDADEIIVEMCKYGVFACEKQVLTYMGIDMGDCRRPFLPLSAEGKIAMKKVADKILAENK